MFKCAALILFVTISEIKTMLVCSFKIVTDETIKRCLVTEVKLLSCRSHGKYRCLPCAMLLRIGKYISLNVLFFRRLKIVFVLFYMCFVYLIRVNRKVMYRTCTYLILRGTRKPIDTNSHL